MIIKYTFSEVTLRKEECIFNDLFSFDIVSAVWEFYDLSDSPSERTDHSVVIYNDEMFVYGGRDETKIYSDLYKFNFSKMKWTQLENNIEEPRMRFGHTAVQWKHYIYIFGGWDGFTTLNDLYCYDITKEEWALIRTQDEVKGRYRHSAVASDNSMFVFGGIDQQHERFNDILEFDFNTEVWSKVVTIGNPPSPRTFHQALYYTGCIYIMGGFDGWKRNDMYKILIDKKAVSTADEEEKELNSDGVAKKEIFTPEYFQSMPLNKWQKIKCNGDLYTPRTGHEVIAYDEKIYLFGGTDDDQRKNDLYCYDIYKNTWELLKADGDVPSRRSGSRGIGYKD